MVPPTSGRPASVSASAARPHAAAVERGDRASPAAAGRGEPAFACDGREAVAKPGGRADDEALEAPAGVDVTPTSAARLHRPSHCATKPARPPPSAAPQRARAARRDRAIDSATDSPAPTPAPPAAPQHPPMSGQHGRPGRATRCCRARPARIKRRRRRRRALPPGRRRATRQPSELPRPGCGAAQAQQSPARAPSRRVRAHRGSAPGLPPPTSQRVSRSSARANAWRGRVPSRRSASDVPSACSSSAASR